jgi:hypothetical protein
MKIEELKFRLWLAWLLSLVPLLAPATLEDVERVPGLWIPGAVWFMYLVLRSED